MENLTNSKNASENGKTPHGKNRATRPKDVKQKMPKRKEEYRPKASKEEIPPGEGQLFGEKPKKKSQGKGALNAPSKRKEKTSSLIESSNRNEASKAKAATDVQKQKKFDLWELYKMNFCSPTCKSALACPKAIHPHKEVCKNFLLDGECTAAVCNRLRFHWKEERVLEIISAVELTCGSLDTKNWDQKQRQLVLDIMDETDQNYWRALVNASDNQSEFMEQPPTLSSTKEESKAPDGLKSFDTFDPSFYPAFTTQSPPDWLPTECHEEFYDTIRQYKPYEVTNPFEEIPSAPEMTSLERRDWMFTVESDTSSFEKLAPYASISDPKDPKKVDKEYLQPILGSHRKPILTRGDAFWRLATRTKWTKVAPYAIDSGEIAHLALHPKCRSWPSDYPFRMPDKRKLGEPVEKSLAWWMKMDGAKRETKKPDRVVREGDFDSKRDVHMLKYIPGSRGGLSSFGTTLGNDHRAAVQEKLRIAQMKKTMDEIRWEWVHPIRGTLGKAVTALLVCLQSFFFTMSIWFYVKYEYHSSGENTDSLQFGTNDWEQFARKEAQRYHSTYFTVFTTLMSGMIPIIIVWIIFMCMQKKFRRNRLRLIRIDPAISTMDLRPDNHSLAALDHLDRIPATFEYTRVEDWMTDLFLRVCCKCCKPRVPQSLVECRLETVSHLVIQKHGTFLNERGMLWNLLDSYLQKDQKTNMDRYADSLGRDHSHLGSQFVAYGLLREAVEDREHWDFPREPLPCKV